MTITAVNWKNLVDQGLRLCLICDQSGGLPLVMEFGHGLLPPTFSDKEQLADPPTGDRQQTVAKGRGVAPIGDLETGAPLFEFTRCHSRGGNQQIVQPPWAGKAGGVGRIEDAMGVTRDRTRSAHLVGRLRLTGATPLSWQLRRDRDLLLAETEQRAEGIGKTWIEKIEIATTAPISTSTGNPSADPVLELGELVRNDIIHQHGVREAIRDLVKELRDDLPPEARGFSGDNEAAFEALVDQLLSEGSEDMLARLKPEASEIS